MRVLVAAAVQTVELLGNVGLAGTLSTRVCAGGQDVVLQVDTGSSDVGLISTLCKRCRKHDINYDPRKAAAVPRGAQGVHCDTAYKTKQCAIEQGFADGSGWSAALYTDTFSFGRCDAKGLETEAVVGAVYEVTGQLENHDVSGLLGLAYASEAEAAAATPLDRLVKQGMPDVFAMLVCRDSVVPGAPAGQLVLGGDGADLATTPLVYTPITKESFYVVEMTGIFVGDRRLPVSAKALNAGDAIVDSGTTLVDLPRGVFNAVADGLAGLCSKTRRIKGLCYQSGPKTGKALPAASSILHSCTFLDSLYGFPAIGFEVGGQRFDLEPSQYIIGGTTMCPNDPPGHYRIGLEAGESLILGMVFMQGRLTVFDRANKRVGFATASGAACSRSVLV